MSFFCFFKRKSKVEEQQSTAQKLINRYLVESSDCGIPFGRQERNYKITDMNNGKEFMLNIIYDIFDVAYMDKTEANYNDIEDNRYKVSVGVISAESPKPLAFFSSENFQKDFEGEYINIKDVDLALYNQLKEARQDSSNPQKQEEAYLVSTLLRATHDNIWIAPLLKHKDKPEYSAKLEQIKNDVKEASEKAQKKIQKYKEKHKKEQDNKGVLSYLLPKPKKKSLSDEQLQQIKSEYIQSLAKENLVDGY